MEPNVLLAQLRALLERAPDLSKFESSSREQQLWLAQAHALISRWNSIEAIGLKSSSDFLALSSVRDLNVSKIFGCINRAIADLELIVPAEAQTSFGADDVYDFFKALNGVIASAESEIFIIDPYLDQSVFDHYLISRHSNVKVRLLSKNNGATLVISAQKYNDQHGNILEMRISSKIHDRLIFVDRYVCWLVGQSVKDAARAKPTYLVPAPPDVVPEKLKNYEQIWVEADQS
jgi:hypothetical protein